MLSIVRKQADIRHTGAGSSRDLIVPEVEIGLEIWAVLCDDISGLIIMNQTKSMYISSVTAVVCLVYPS